MQVFQIGRSYEEPIKINKLATSVSHDHATITIDDDGNWTLIDNNSTNGTYIEINGTFCRCSRVHIGPDTWIRLGMEGPRGHTFKARRVIAPNNYQVDFKQLYEQYREYANVTETIEKRRDMLKYLMPALSLIGLLASLPIKTNMMAIRGVMLIPGIVSPILQTILLNGLNRRKKAMSKELICPKCRHKLSEYDVQNRTCSYCKAL